MVSTQIQKRITLKNNDSNTNTSNYTNLSSIFTRLCNRTLHKYKIIKTIYYEKESFKLLGIVPV